MDVEIFVGQRVVVPARSVCCATHAVIGVFLEGADVLIERKLNQVEEMHQGSAVPLIGNPVITAADLGIHAR